MTDATKQPPSLPPGADSPEDFVQRAMILYGQKRLSEVVKVCRLGLLADPRRQDGRLVLGRALMALNKYDDVLAEVGVMLQQDPDNYRALMLKAEALVRKKDYLQAREVLMHVEDLDPFNHQASQLLDYLDDELERAGEPVAHVTTDTRQYPSSKAKEITAKDVSVTPETGKFLEQSTAEALQDLSTGEPGDGWREGEGWEEEESTQMDMAPSFEDREDTPLQEKPTWDGEPQAETSALQASVTWEGAITGAGVVTGVGAVTGAGPLDAQPTVEDDSLLKEWSGGGEVEGLEPTVTEGGGTAWDGGGEVEGLYGGASEGSADLEAGTVTDANPYSLPARSATEKVPTVTEGEEAAWYGGGEVEQMEPTVTGGDEEPEQ